MSSAAAVKTAMNAATAALASGDYATAITQATIAQGHLAAMPNTRFGDNHEMAWSDQRINDFIVNVRRLQSSTAAATAGGVQRTRINYVRPTS